MTRAALWIRISTDDQNDVNQVALLENWAKARGWDIVTRFEVRASGWRGKHHPQLVEAIAAAHRRDYDVLVLRSLDRLSRQGVEAMLNAWRRFEEAGVKVASYQEPFVTELSGMPSLQEMLISFVAWAARETSEKISTNTRNALAAKRDRGERIGRPPGAKDKRRRRTRSDRGVPRRRQTAEAAGGD